MMLYYNTLVVNLYGGPGAGKTTLAHGLVAELSKAGVLTEYVAEYAKELVWQNRREVLDGTVENQRHVTGEQMKRIGRLLGKVEVVVTDSPVALGLVYAHKDDDAYESFCAEVIGGVDDCRNFNVYVNRRPGYDQRGRKHTESESKELDASIRRMLCDDVWTRFARSQQSNRIAVEYCHETDAVTGCDTGSNNFDEVLGAILITIESDEPEERLEVYPCDGHLCTTADPHNPNARHFVEYAHPFSGPYVEVVNGEELPGFWSYCNWWTDAAYLVLSC